MTGEQRRTLDVPAQQPVAESAVKVPHPIEVDRVLINPHDLDNYLPADGAMLRQHGVVHDREPIVRPCITFGWAIPEGCACTLAYPRLHHLRVADSLLIPWKKPDTASEPP